MRHLFFFFLFLLSTSAYSQNQEKPWPKGNWYFVYGTDTSFMRFSEGSYTVQYKLNKKHINLTGTVKRVNDDTFEIIYSPEPHLENQFLQIIDVQPNKLIIKTGMFKNMQNTSQQECFPLGD